MDAAVAEKPASHVHRSGGPTPKPINWNVLKSMAAYFCPTEEICACIEMSYSQVNERCKEENGTTLAEFLQYGESKGKAEIRRQQFLLLQRGNAAMAKWMGMQHLGQAPVVKITHKVAGGAPAPIDPDGFQIVEVDAQGHTVSEVIAALPEPKPEATRAITPSQDNADSQPT